MEREAGGVDVDEPPTRRVETNPRVQSEIRFAELLADSEEAEAELEGAQSGGTPMEPTPAEMQTVVGTEPVRIAEPQTASQEGAESSSGSVFQKDGGMDDAGVSAQQAGQADRRDDRLSESEKRLVTQWVGKGLEELRRGRTFSGMDGEELQADTSFKGAVRTPPASPIWVSALCVYGGVRWQGAD
jgi:hypothetical protein